nr:GGDEF domain-containing protein [Ectothiorhodospira shaposhnikovii]
MALMVIEADHFKLVNDRYGHATGDAVLRTLVATSATVLRATDLFARLGGEEFGVILPDTGAEGAMGLGERLLTAMRETVTEHDGYKLRFTVSIGVAMLEPDDTSLEALLHHADLALYKAKAEGRDRLGLIARP